MEKMKNKNLLKQQDSLTSRTAIEAEILFAVCLSKKQALTGGKSLAREDKCSKKIGAVLVQQADRRSFEASAVFNFVFFVMLKNKIEQSAKRKLLLNSPTDRTFGNRWSRYKEIGKKVPQAYRVYVEDTFLPCDAGDARIFSKEETGLYYYGARYLDPKYSRWLSGDPALNDYIPKAPIDDEAKKHNENLPGMGGVYNTVNLHVYHYAGNNPVKYVDPDGRVPWLAIPIIIGFTLLLQSDSQPSQRQGLPYEPDKWNSNLDIMVRTNCYAYAMNFQKNPVTGKSFPKRGEGGFALQPGDLFGYKLKDLQPSTIEFLVSLDCIKINYTFKETTFEKSVKKGNWKIALVIRSDDYHWYRQNEDGSWSHKQGSTPVKDTDDAGNKIFDPREAKSSYKFVKFYEVGPND